METYLTAYKLLKPGDISLNNGINILVSIKKIPKSEDYYEIVWLTDLGVLKTSRKGGGWGIWVLQ